MGLFGMAGKDIGVDLGTANVLVTIKGKGIVLREPSVVAVNKLNGEIVATGQDAKEMLGRTPENIKAIKPMMNGAIADLNATSMMIKNMMHKVSKEYNVGKPRFVVGVPSGITEVEERAVEEAFFQCGAREINLISEPVASAIGAGLNIFSTSGKMIVDIGGGTTEVAVISYGEIVSSTSIKVAGNAIDKAIADYLKRTQKFNIGLSTAEYLKIQIGCAKPLVADITEEIKGSNTETGLPMSLVISSKQINEAIQDCINEIVEAVINTLAVTPPDLVSDIMENGIYLAGGGALIKNIDNLIAEKTGVQTFIADEPLDCVAIGTGKSLENIQKYRKVFLNNKSR